MTMRRAPFLALFLGLAVAGAARAAEPARLGAGAYEKYCSQCHGDRGDGKGAAAGVVLPKPRDFTSGKFKIRTTPSGALPTDDDLRHIIRAGMPYTAMPAWPQLSDRELDQIIDYVKKFSPDFANPERKPKPIDIPSPPSISDESVARGKKVYEENGCAGCHGALGRGNGSSAPSLKDDWGHSIRPADLTKRWTFRGGPTRDAIFRAFSTGLNGTPMPSYADSLTVEQRWDLVNYIHSLGKSDTPGYATVLVVKKVEKPIDLASGEDLFADADTAYFPLVGQIMQPGRAFHPAVNGVATRAVYNETEIAIELRWHDLRQDATGKNAPDAKVPPEEDRAEEAPAAAEGGWGDAAESAPASTDPWGEEGGGAAASGSAYSDAVAIQLPVVLPLSIRKPYFLFGDKDHPVHLWFADLAKPKPVLWAAHGSDSLERLGPRGLEMTSGYDDGEWRVTFKRRLRTAGEITFDEGLFVPIAFSVWNGLDDERGNKRALSAWYSLYFEPGERPSPASSMAKWAFGVLVLEVAFIGWSRRRQRRATTGPSPSPGGSTPHV